VVFSNQSHHHLWSGDDVHCDKENGATRNSEHLIIGKAKNMGIRMDNKKAKAARSASGVAVFLFSLLVIYRIDTSVEPGVPDKTQLAARFFNPWHDGISEKVRCSHS
jgi:hypothetical protein